MRLPRSVEHADVEGKTVLVRSDLNVPLDDGRIADDSAVNTRLGCETLATTNKIVIAGEGRGQAPLFKKFGNGAVINRELIAQIARDVVKDILEEVQDISFVRFGGEDVVRHKLVQRIVAAYDAHGDRERAARSEHGPTPRP